MNIEQFDELRRGIALMRGTVEEDTTGIDDITRALDELEFEVDKELKNLLWVRYLEAEG